MKIGLSFSRCLKDIIDGNVDYDDVLVIIARTDFDPNDDEQWQGIWHGYALGSNPFSNPEWFGDQDKEDRYRALSILLYGDGKLHQPRKFGAYPKRMSYFWLETVLPAAELDSNPSVKLAWDHFQTVAGLSSIGLTKHA
jgi:hypothetical protein